ncbi:helix-turn-helix domain-containing protein [Weissella viridescens]|uniref:helix-turn-helix domain-containing protein n=1 Tax=Weissella viridescens TaxID=1629 RepID=UPI001D077DE1|nr:helix-turn-helix transcriptional regulator [Weissella viridescens]MCB6839913.1 helix-turn-helix domain-containing protein [Weissella viridescens]MCB6846645.1 helix-turn-helix domain-containing protein [Weissella viridescens]
MGNRLKELRESQQMSARHVSFELGLSQNMYSSYERGEKEPTISTLKKIARLFNVSADYLLGLTDEKWTQKKR